MQIWKKQKFPPGLYYWSHWSFPFYRIPARICIIIVSDVTTHSLSAIFKLSPYHNYKRHSSAYHRIGRCDTAFDYPVIFHGPHTFDVTSTVGVCVTLRENVFIAAMVTLEWVCVYLWIFELLRKKNREKLCLFSFYILII